MFRSILLTCAAAAAVSSQSIQSVLDSHSDTLSMFNTYVRQAGLLDTLNSLGDVTIFAPTNDALKSALNEYPDLLLTSGSDSDNTTKLSEQFKNILMYHVIPSTAVTPADINPYPGSFYPTAYNGIVVNPFNDGQGVKVFSQEKRISEVAAAGLEISNGFIHTVDQILLPPDGPATTAHDMGFLYFYGGLLETDLVKNLNTTDPVTIFIPTDEAFTDVGSALKELSTEDLVQTFRYHAVLNNAWFTTNFSDGDTLETAANTDYESGLDVTVDESDGALYINNARVITPNILLRNGVAHLISQVLNFQNDDPGYGFDYNLDGEVDGVIAFEDAASATVPALTSGLATPTSTFSPTATFSQVSAAGDIGKPGALTLFGVIYAALLAMA